DVRDAAVRPRRLQPAPATRAGDAGRGGIEVIMETQQLNPPKKSGDGDGRRGDHSQTNQHPHEEHPIPDDLPKVSTAVIAGVAALFVVLLAVLFAVGYFPNRKRHQEAAAVAAEKRSVPRVDVVQPRKPS